MVFKPVLLETKTITLKGDELEEYISIMLSAFIEKWGEEPSGIILGPLEYLSLINFFEKKNGPRFNRRVNSIFGYHFRLKASKGIELEIPHDFAKYFVKGEVSQND